MNKDVSIVIPAYKNDESLPLLLKCINNQKFPPKTVIIVNSKLKENLNLNLNSQELKFELKIINIDPAFPGKARNYGIDITKTNFIAFLDCKTFPKQKWLSTSLEYLIKNKKEAIIGSRSTQSTNQFSELIKALTYGNNIVTSLSGTLLYTKIARENLFDNKIRAGEDLIWIEKISKKFKTFYQTKDLLVYNNLPTNFKTFIFKWFVYSQHNSNITELLINQRKYYMIIILFLVMINIIYFFQNYLNFTFNYAYLVYVYVVLFSLYFIIRSIVRPYFVANMPLKFILPFNWLKIGFLGFLIDVIKIPGLLKGFIYQKFRI